MDEVEKDSAVVSDEITDDTTDAVMFPRCTECGQDVEAFVYSPPPRLEELSDPLFWQSCVTYGQPVVWWFCRVEGWYGIAGIIRIRIARP